MATTAPALKNRLGWRWSKGERNHRPPCAFGLVELLAVLTLIVVLAALLFVNVPRLVEQSTRMRCAQNLRQLYAGFMAYATDHGGKIPFGARDPDIPDANSNYYGGIYGAEFKNYIPGKRVAGNNTGYIEPYLCPADREIRMGNSYGFLGHSYGVNMKVCNNYNRISTWRYPSRTFLLADSLGPVIASTVPQQRLAPRHADGANTLFLDGHVEWIKAPFPVWSDNRGFWDPVYEP